MWIDSGVMGGGERRGGDSLGGCARFMDTPLGRVMRLPQEYLPECVLVTVTMVVIAVMSKSRYGIIFVSVYVCRIFV